MAEHAQNSEWRVILRRGSAFLGAILLTVAQFRWAIVSFFYGGAEWLAAHWLLPRQAVVPIYGITGFLLETALLLLIVRIWEGNSWKSIGLLPPSAGTLFLGTGIWLLDLMIWPWTYGIMQAASAAISAMLPAAAAVSASLSRPSAHTTPAMCWFLLDNAADVLYEEILRAYVIERIVAFTKSVWLAGLVGSLFFLGLHKPGRDLEGVMQMLPMTFAFSFFYVWRRDAVACMLGHFLMNTALPLLDKYRISWLWTQVEIGRMWRLLALDLVLYSGYLWLARTDWRRSLRLPLTPSGPHNTRGVKPETEKT